MTKTWMSVALLAGLFSVVGCGQQPIENVGVDKKGKEVAKAGDKKTTPADPSDEDGGEWCNPHGVAEEECSMCSSKAAKEFKAKGDWCEKARTSQEPVFHL